MRYFTYFRFLRKYYIFTIITIVTLIWILRYLNATETVKSVLQNQTISLDVNEHFPIVYRYPPNGLIPQTVHYIWCKRKAFQFQHFMSIKSVIKYIQPYKIVFHYDVLPADEWYNYYTWFDELRAEVPYIVLKRLDSPCSTNFNNAKDLLTPGGIYFPIDAIMVANPDDFWNVSTPMENLRNEQEGIVVVKEDQKKYTGRIIPCSPKNLYDHGGYISCVLTTEEIKPFDIMFTKSRFCSFTRNLVYGNQNIPVPKTDNLTPSPRHVHLVYLGHWKMEYMTYLSLLSDLYVAEVDHVFIHCTSEPEGRYWDELKKNPRISRLKIDPPDAIFNRTLSDVKFASDVLRLQLLLKYGGIYHDMDVIWTQRIPDKYFTYDAIMGYDWPTAEPWPDQVNNGCLFGKKGAKFLKEWLQMYKRSPEKISLYNSLQCPIHVYERHPDAVFLNPHLQVICYMKVCHPPWIPNYKSSLSKNFDVGKWNWLDTFAVHFSFPIPEEFASEEVLINSVGMYAEIGQNVLSKRAIKNLK